MSKRPQAPYIPGVTPIFTDLGDFRSGDSARGTLPDWGFAITCAGAVLYDADTRRLTARPGDCCITRPGHPQYWRVPATGEGGPGRWRILYCIFTPRPHWHAWLNVLATEGLRLFRPQTRARRREVFRALKRGHTLRMRGGRYADELAMHYLERALLLCARDSSLTLLESAIDPRVQKAVDHLTLNPHEPIRLEQLARRCHLSRAHLWMLFQRQIGTTPLQFQERRRIEEAQRRLRSTLDPIRAIAAACGFEDARYFSTRFKKQTQMTPREYRAQFIGRTDKPASI
jgi:AraC-like DNA-binding protein